MRRLALALLLLSFSWVAALAQIAILGTGQSNDWLTLPMVWSPPSNAVIWNNVPQTDGSAGAAFVPLSSTTINVAQAFAAEIARLNPTKTVCLVNVPWSSMDVGHWLSGYTAGGVTYPVVSPDVWHNIEINAAPALLACPGSPSLFKYIKDFQGESDAVEMNAAYLAMLRAKIGRLSTEPWYQAGSTKIVLFGIAGSNITALPWSDTINANRVTAVADDPVNRAFVPTGILPPPGSLPPAYWDSVTLGHMAAQGLATAGTLGADLATDSATDWIPYLPKTSCLIGSAIAPFAATAVGEFRLAGHKTVHVNLSVTSPTIAACSLLIEASLPLPAAPFYMAAAGYDVGMARAYAVAIAPSDPNSFHIFSATGGFPDGQSSPAVTATYHRQ